MLRHRVTKIVVPVGLAAGAALSALSLSAPRRRPQPRPPTRWPRGTRWPASPPGSAPLGRRWPPTTTWPTRTTSRPARFCRSHRPASVPRRCRPRPAPPARAMRPPPPARIARAARPPARSRPASGPARTAGPTAGRGTPATSAPTSSTARRGRPTVGTRPTGARRRRGAGSGVRQHGRILRLLGVDALRRLLAPPVAPRGGRGGTHPTAAPPLVGSTAQRGRFSSCTRRPTRQCQRSAGPDTNGIHTRYSW